MKNKRRSTDHDARLHNGLRRHQDIDVTDPRCHHIWATPYAGEYRVPPLLQERERLQSLPAAKTNRAVIARWRRQRAFLITLRINWLYALGFAPRSHEYAAAQQQATEIAT